MKYFWIGLALLIILGVAASFYVKSKPGALDGFAQCLTEKSVTFYGAFWCPNCASQKRLFGRSAELLSYVECSTADSQGQLAVCKDAGIEQYPTWEFADASRLTGVQPLAVLAEKSGCILPQN
ncbi:hypothetical protein A2673_01685 [Candidatus Kaiserbacteria bacterium RIFCSPHIGHO2_01_FULL_50_13]|uniref:Thioredoxin domain-containing protein n=1 Tax=Candidatus Kaiserbacteria bacterium RIFCSPLOWO2_01_FULL_50_24 TaxID=1798507 RepID=A0A1F6EMG6_9BACT|nr:MAG: hypothetical protein A2673_01685 [Candidatus Kaiserbacteria bacterium RIFCSPHIGHO2_01_FULL_50_13]OGG74831.1 MAG: hypothetical protein A3A34_00385 [Candidatus Kaiserbacteria bacterium RIFCSPLOWO2_01_FULL_50_24]OGG81414.1 MAG: hypothetical protein A3H74_03170 [Candidatus Kaiserbacteria bacterium RIFCSPLOWO2_02_FULL_51_13]